LSTAVVDLGSETKGPVHILFRWDHSSQLKWAQCCDKLQKQQKTIQFLDEGAKNRQKALNDN